MRAIKQNIFLIKKFSLREIVFPDYFGRMTKEEKKISRYRYQPLLLSLSLLSDHDFLNEFMRVTLSGFSANDKTKIANTKYVQHAPDANKKSHFLKAKFLSFERFMNRVDWCGICVVRLTKLDRKPFFFKGKFQVL